MEPRVLHPDLAPLERSVLHLRRKGMRDRVTKDSKTDWRIDIARCFAAILEIGERITLCRMISIHVMRIERTKSRMVLPEFSFRGQLYDLPCKPRQRRLSSPKR